MSKLEEQVKTYVELAKKDKKIDIASLMMTAMDDAKHNHLPVKEKRWAFIISLSIPFIGFYYAFKYFNSNADDANETALACGILACVCLISFWMVQGTLGSSLSGGQLQGVQDLKPSDVYELTQ